MLEPQRQEIEVKGTRGWFWPFGSTASVSLVEPGEQLARDPEVRGARMPTVCVGAAWREAGWTKGGRYAFWDQSCQ